MSQKLLVCALFLSLSLAACDSDSSNDQEDVPRTLRLDLRGFEPLTNGFHYEGWALSTGAANVSTGKFNVDAAGNLVDLNGNPIPNNAFETNVDLSVSPSMFITIEPAGDTNQTPSATRFLGGDFNDGVAELTVEHRSALGVSLFLATGTYILSTPTNGPDSNEDSGVWFINLTAGPQGRGLTVPNLPSGWTYEGWTIIDGIPVTTGTFKEVSGADDAAPYSGPMEGFAFPGEDFLVNAPAGLSFPTFLSGATVVVSVEPSPDPDPAPFTLKLFSGAVPGNATNEVTYNLKNNANAFPTGTAQVR
ncbi:MAG: hypothetical protein IH820_03510 [Bacteroidetes bacterium]|nr:hypothetical protein [Bacteroidota bacterium]